MRNLTTISAYGKDLNGTSSFICQTCGKDHRESTTTGNNENTLDTLITSQQQQTAEYKKKLFGNRNLSNVSLVKQKSQQQENVIRTTINNVDERISFQTMLDEIRKLFDKADTVEIDEVEAVLAKYKSNKEDWQKYAFYENNRYKRNLVEEHQKYNIMILTWGEGAKSTIHDHSGSHCFMKLLDGKLDEIRYSWPSENHEGEMQVTSVNSMSKGKQEIVYINDKVGLHRVQNASDKSSGATLHIYIPPYRSCRSFEEKSGRSMECKVIYDSMRGQLVARDFFKSEC